MARRVTREGFDKGRPLVVARGNLIASGHRFKAGDPFPWRKLSVALRRVVQMYNMGLVRHEGDAMVETPEPEAPSTENLDDIDNLAALQSIAEKEGVELKRSKAEQREAIKEAREEKVSNG